MIFKLSKPQYLIFFVFTATFIMNGCGRLSAPLMSDEQFNQKIVQKEIQELRIKKIPLTVEVVRSNAEKARGLSGREILPEGRGMIFLFDSPGYYGFWMQGMNFSLDFMWLSGNNIVQIDTDIPAPSLQNPKPVNIIPSQPIDGVIEVPSGWVVRNKINIGDEIEGLTR